MSPDSGRTKIADEQSLAERLTAAGLSPESAAPKAAVFTRLVDALAELDNLDRLGRETPARRRDAPPEPPSDADEGQEEDAAKLLAVFVPGRIELLGKHTDYAGGQSMTVAAERGFCMAARARDNRWITVVDVAGGESVRFLLDPDLEPLAGCWSNYPMTVARRLARNFPGIERGADIAFASDLPRAAGMSSSSAFMVAVYLLLAEINQIAQREEYRKEIGGTSDLAAYLATIENGRRFGSLQGDLGVGTLGGSEDQTAILCSEAQQIGRYSYCPVVLEERLPMPSDCVFAVGVSGVVAEKTGAAREKYNTASRLAATLLDIWNRGAGRDDPTLAAAIHSAPDAVDRLKELLQSDRQSKDDQAALRKRLEHFLTENDEVIPQVAAALTADDRDALGQWVDHSQDAAEQLLGNQVPETCFLASEARRQGALAAAAFGAGFGGSVWALVEQSQASRFLADWTSQYRQAFPQHADASRFFLTDAGPAAFWLELE